MKKKIFGGIAILGIAAFVAFNVNLSTNKEVPLLVLANVEALAQESGGDLWKGYINAVENCKVSETKRCDFEIWIPGIGYCQLGFDYIIKHEGKENPCTYTGNENNQCDYYRCIKSQ